MFDLISLKGGLANVEGFFCGGVSAGLKPEGQKDVAFIRSEKECDISALFTTNNFQAAPIKHFKKYPENFKTNFILINSKNANAMTGGKGIKDIDYIFENLKFKDLKNPVMSSTGVIGYPLDKTKIINAANSFDINSKDSKACAQAIMTTDSFEKELALRVELENGEFFHIAGIAKGAGMINPAMATMLCFLLTDADIPKNDMEELLKESADNSFNRISVDGDTSTNDTVMLIANKAKNCYDKTAFKEALNFLTKNLAMMILKDGEGANKVVKFEVKNAKSTEEAKKAAKALSNSLLVKTALFGEDPNWGRIASTIGASNIQTDEDSLEIWYDDVLIYSKDKPILDEKTEKEATTIMQKDEFKIVCNLNMGEYSYSAYGCDLSYEYVKINADYRT